MSLSNHQADTTPNSSAADSATRLEVIFIDSNVSDIEKLLSGLREKSSPETDWRIIPLESDDDIANTTNIDSIHLVSHGTDGILHIGKTELSLANSERFVEHFRSWDIATRGQTDLLIYGCDLAYSETGRKLVDTIAHHSDLDVAASNNTTGHSALHRDWQLEYQSGEITTSIAFNNNTTDAWQSTLATPNAIEISTTNYGGLNLNHNGGNDTYLQARNGTLLFAGLQQFTFEVQLSSTDLQSGDTFAHYRTATTEPLYLS